MHTLVNWYICANTTDVVKNFAVIESISFKSFHCIEVKNQRYKTYGFFFGGGGVLRVKKFSEHGQVLYLWKGDDE